MNAARSTLCLLALGIAGGLANSAAIAAAPYRCVYLADAAAEDFSWPEAIGAQGTIVGLGSANALGPRAARWKRTAVEDLGDLVPDQGLGSRAYGVNAKGVVVGSGRNESLDTRPVRWKAGVIEELPTLTGGLSGEARGVDGTGHVVGLSSQADSGLPSHAVLWRGERVIDLGALGPRHSRPQRASIARAINDAGTIVGDSDFDDQHNWHAVRWDSAQAIHELGQLAGGTHSSAYALNEAGVIVGRSNYSGGPLYRFHAVAWVDDVPLDIGALPDHVTSQARGINNANVIVGSSASEATNSSRAVIWRGLDQAPVDLNTLLRDFCMNDVAHRYTLVEAVGINDSGVIAATGWTMGWDGGPRFGAFRLVPR
jgi:probable HAF family extracellular repeat protein